MLAFRRLSLGREIITRTPIFVPKRNVVHNNPNLNQNSTQTKHRELVFSGIQPTGNLHLGNYLGAVINWVNIQKQANNENKKLLFSLVDLHSLTSVRVEDNATFPRTRLDEEAHEMAIALLACGIDPAQSSLFRQSHVLQHNELTWILGCLTPVSWLNNMIQFKEKKDDGFLASMGLYSYPVLMAADVLLYKATQVPVGEDQRQHLELIRKIASTFNQVYKTEFFPIPQSLHTPTTRIMSLTDGKSKMSKSNISDLTRINLVDDADTLHKKIKKAKMDSEVGITYNKSSRPEVSNLMEIFSALSNRSLEDIESQYRTALNSTFKADLTNLLVEKLAPITKDIHRLRKDPEYVNQVLSQGADTARDIAEENMKQVRKIIGL